SGAVPGSGSGVRSADIFVDLRVGSCLGCVARCAELPVCAGGRLLPGILETDHLIWLTVSPATGASKSCTKCRDCSSMPPGERMVARSLNHKYQHARLRP